MLRTVLTHRPFCKLIAHTSAVKGKIDFFRNVRCISFSSGYPLEALLLELQLLDSTTRVPGETLTGVEKRYRTQWIGALHAVMQHVSGTPSRARYIIRNLPWLEADQVMGPRHYVPAVILRGHPPGY